ncbi:MAG: hypothetical protein IJQ82_03415 [Selenomonadaceae bacterium]|nr:hypothetical protein [Selenomonadaceae bacterium]
MHGQNFLVKKLSWHYEDFLKYCQEAGKTFVEELDREDFIAYRSEYAVSHKEIEQLKNALNFQDKQPVEEISPPKKSLLLALPILKLLSTKFALTWELAQKKSQPL